MNFDFIDSTTLDLDVLWTADWGRAFTAVQEAMLDPSSNLPVAILTLIITSILVTIVLVMVLFFVMGARDDEDDEYTIEEAVATAVAGATPTAVVGPDGSLIYDESAIPEIEVVQRKRYPWLDAAIIVLVFGFAWFALGLGTSQDDVCLSCHTETPHTQAMAAVESGDVEYIHDDLDCVECHESDGIMGRYGTESVHRSVHFVFGFGWSDQNDYGAVTTAACEDCHGAVFDGKTESELRGVYMSHAEPAEAGWECVDCHKLQDGLLVEGIGGMVACITCHDEQTATADCESCHYKDVSVASSAPTFDIERKGTSLVPIPDCGGCHNQVTECDPCHDGVRMPHSANFRRIGHAREAVVNYWYGDGNACFGCHTKDRNPCGECHTGQMWSHLKTWKIGHQSGAKDGSGCARCHDRTRNKVPERNFCVDVCHQDKPQWRVR